MQNTKKIWSFLAELIFMSTLLIALIFLLIIFYPYPYDSIGSLEGLAAYDAEPDYFANIISTILNGHSMDFLHPGIPLNHLSAASLNFFSENLSTEKIIYIPRAVILFTNGMLIYIGSRLVLKQTLICTFALYAVFFVFPAGFFLLDNLSPNSILFGLSVLTIAVGSLVKKSISMHMTLFAFLLGLALAVKYVAIVLALPLATYLAFDRDSRSAQEQNLFKIFSYITLITGISFSVFAWPMLPFLPYVLTHHGFNFSDFGIHIQSSGFIVLVSLAFIAICILITYLYAALSNLAFSNVYRYVSTFFLISLLIMSFIKLSSAESLMFLGYSLRNYLPILGMMVLFIPGILKAIFKSSIQHYICIILVLFLFTGLKQSFNMDSFQKASNAEQEFSSFLNEYDDYDFLVFYPASSFISKDLFIAWADYRYGDSRTIFSEEEVPFLLTERQKKARILNSRKFNLDLPEKKFSYRYFKALSQNKLLRDPYKQVALNQMHLLQSKSFCNELFDGFEETKSSAIFFPISLKAYHIGNDLHSDDLQTYSYVNDIKIKLKNTCNINSEITHKISYNLQKFYILLIN